MMMNDNQQCEIKKENSGGEDHREAISMIRMKSVLAS
jgi:hypothetical protein